MTAQNDDPSTVSLAGSGAGVASRIAACLSTELPTRVAEPSDRRARGRSRDLTAASDVILKTCPQRTCRAIDAHPGEEPFFDGSFEPTAFVARRVLHRNARP